MVNEGWKKKELRVDLLAKGHFWSLKKFGNIDYLAPSIAIVVFSAIWNILSFFHEQILSFLIIVWANSSKGIRHGSMAQHVNGPHSMNISEEFWAKHTDILGSEHLSPTEMMRHRSYSFQSR